MTSQIVCSANKVKINHALAKLRFSPKNLTLFGRHIGACLLVTLLLIFVQSATAETSSEISAETYAQSQSFGRLFSTPAERSRLNTLRQTQVLKLIPTTEEVVTEELTIPTTLTAPISMQGYVKRSDGAKSTVWINNRAVQEGSEVNSVRIGNLQKNSINNSQNLNLQIPANGQRLRLKAGQIYTPETNQILELKNIAKNPILMPKDVAPEPLSSPSSSPPSTAP